MLGGRLTVANGRWPASAVWMGDAWMGKRKKPRDSDGPPAPPPEPTIYEAVRGGEGTGGRVYRVRIIGQAEAEALRQAGSDVVVCGPQVGPNRNLARQIETNANGSCLRCDPHVNEGPYALPHYHPATRNPAGHTFYETDNLKSFDQ